MSEPQLALSLFALVRVRNFHTVPNGIVHGTSLSLVRFRQILHGREKATAPVGPTERTRSRKRFFDF